MLSDRERAMRDYPDEFEPEDGEDCEDEEQDNTCPDCGGIISNEHVCE